MAVASCAMELVKFKTFSLSFVRSATARTCILAASNYRRMLRFRFVKSASLLAAVRQTMAEIREPRWNRRRRCHFVLCAMQINQYSIQQLLCGSRTMSGDCATAAYTPKSVLWDVPALVAGGAILSCMLHVDGKRTAIRERI